MNNKLTCLIGTYNEAVRLPAFLAHATQWADHVVIVDKCSNDDTRKIARAAGLKVELHIVPFTPQGHEDKLQQFNCCQTDWVFLMTPGEVPTRELISKVRAAIDQHWDTVDIITVPKKLYSFGIHNPASPWSIGQQPFVINRTRALISNHVHRNFRARSAERYHHIQYSEACHVFHPTHATVRDFLRSHTDYILAEAEGCANPDDLLREAQQQIVSQQFGGNIPELFGQSCAWKFYWLGCMMAAWEKKQARNVPAEYRAAAEEMIRTQWM